MATKFRKPDGFKVIRKHDRGEIFLLDVDKIWGIGKRIKPRLNRLGIWTVQELA